MHSVPCVPANKLNLKLLSTSENNPSSISATELDYEKDVSPYLREHVYKPFITQIYPYQIQLDEPTLEISGVIKNNKQAELKKEPYFLQLIALLGTDEHFYMPNQSQAENQIFHKGALHTLGLKLGIKTQTLKKSYGLINKLLKLPELFWPNLTMGTKEQTEFKSYLKNLKRELEVIYFIAQKNYETKQQEVATIKQSLEVMLEQFDVCAPGLAATLSVIKNDLSIKNISSMLSSFILDKISEYQAIQTVSGKINATISNGIHVLIKLTKIAKEIGLSVGNIQKLDDRFENQIQIDAGHFKEYLCENITINNFITHALLKIKSDIAKACEQLNITINNNFISYDKFEQLESHIIRILKNNLIIDANVIDEIPRNYIELKYDQTLEDESPPTHFRIVNIEFALLNILSQNGFCSKIEEEYVNITENAKINILYTNLGQDSCPTLCYINRFGELKTLSNDLEQEILESIFTHSSEILVSAISMYAVINGYEKVFLIAYQQRKECFANFVFEKLYGLALKYKQNSILNFLISNDQDLECFTNAVANNQIPNIKPLLTMCSMQQKQHCVDYLLQTPSSNLVKALMEKNLIQARHLPILASETKDMSCSPEFIMDYLKNNDLIMNYIKDVKTKDKKLFLEKVLSMFSGHPVEEMVLDYIIENQLINDVKQYNLMFVVSNNCHFKIIKFYIEKPTFLNYLFSIGFNDCHKVMNMIANLDYEQAVEIINLILNYNVSRVNEVLYSTLLNFEKTALLTVFLERFYDEQYYSMDVNYLITVNSSDIFSTALRKGDVKLAILTLGLNSNNKKIQEYFNKPVSTSNIQAMKAALLKPTNWAFKNLHVNILKKLLVLQPFADKFTSDALFIALSTKDIDKILLCLNDKILAHMSVEDIYGVFDKVIDVINESYASYNNEAVLRYIINSLESQSGFKIEGWHYSHNKADAKHARAQILKRHKIDIMDFVVLSDFLNNGFIPESSNATAAAAVGFTSAGLPEEVINSTQDFNLDDEIINLTQNFNIDDQADNGSKKKLRFGR